MFSLLKGIRVLDFSRLLPGAYATSKLADLGADVIKIEQPPAGDYLREAEPQMDGLGLFHINFNRNKRSIAIDLRTDEGSDVFRKLLLTADVFVEGGRPGAAARVGLDYESLRAVKPDLIYCSVSGYGQTGPYADLPSHGGNLEAATGFIDIAGLGTGQSAAAPNVRVFMASQSGGTHAALAIAAALVQRLTTGEGVYLDVSCWDGAISWHYGNLTSLANLGTRFPGSEKLGAKYGCYRTSDDRWIAVGLVERKFWERFCEVGGRSDLAHRVKPGMEDYGAEELRPEVATIIGARTQDEWMEIAIGEQLPLAPVLSPEELLENGHMAAREMMVDTQHPETGRRTRLMALPIKVGGQTFGIDRIAPGVGDHTEEILREL